MKLIKNLTCMVLLAFFVAGCKPNNSSNKATYTGTAKGMNGAVEVELTVKGNTILDVKVTKHQESAGISDPALQKVPAEIVSKNSTNVDTVSGATVTSRAIIQAAEMALAKSKGEFKEVAVAPLPFDNPDVIVIGAGSSGINAAIKAAETGAKVYLIEKTDIIGGSIRYAGGTLSAAGTEMQKSAKIDDSNQQFIDDIVRMGGGINIPELTKKHVEKAVEAVNWMDKIGADFGDRIPTQPATYDAFGTPREHRVVGKGLGILSVLEPILNKYIAEKKVALLLNNKVTDLVIENGTVTGVIVDGGKKYAAKATVLATGGYGYSEELIKRYNLKNVLTTSPKHATGDGYILAEKAGAVLHNMEYLPAYAGGVPVKETGFTMSVSANNTAYPGVMWVNMDGNRFMNEFKNLDSEKKNAWAGVKDNTVWILLPEAAKKTQNPLLSVDAAHKNWDRFDAEVQKAEVIFKADSIKELAKKMGVDEVNLEKTVTDYNKAIVSGKDAFGRTKDSMVSFADGAVYAVKTYPYVMLTKGGPLMNVDAQVLDAKKEPIPGLYQCGEIVGGANIGGGASIGGLANTITIVWGHIAGENAAKYALGNR